MSGDLSSSLRQLASPLIHPAPFVRVSANMRKRRTCVLVADFIKGLRLKISFDTTIGLVLLHLHLLPSTRGSRGCRKGPFTFRDASATLLSTAVASSAAANSKDAIQLPKLC